MSRLYSLVALLLLAKPWTLSAGTISYSAIAGTESYMFTPPLSTERFYLTVPPLFVADYSVDKTLEVTFSAPAGFHYSVPAVPPGVTGTFIAISLDVGNDFGVDTLFTGGSMSFGNLSGTQPTTVGVDFHILSGGGFDADALASLNGPLSFKSITMTLPVPPGFTSSYSTSPHANSNLNIEGSTLNSDPGQWAFLEADAAVPEPGPAELIWLGTAALFAMAWRRRRGTR